jgi:hypothetical protein
MGKLNHYQQAMLDAALRYAERGRAVLPVSRSKKPINANGSRSATTDSQQIAAWWQAHPTAQIGIATGSISGIWVIDVELKNGKDGIKALRREFGDQFTIDEKTLVQKTPTGGFQFVFVWDEDREIRNVRDVLEGVDIRGDGGFIVAAPSSFSVDGKRITYQWNDAAYQPVNAPDWAWVLTERAQASRSKPVDLNNAIRGVQQGSRHNDLFRIACMLHSRGVTQATATTFLELLAERCHPPFDPIQAREKVKSAYSRHRTTQGENIQEEINQQRETA